MRNMFRSLFDFENWGGVPANRRRLIETIGLILLTTLAVYAWYAYVWTVPARALHVHQVMLTYNPPFLMWLCILAGGVVAYGSWIRGNAPLETNKSPHHRWRFLGMNAALYCAAAIFFTLQTMSARLTLSGGEFIIAATFPVSDAWGYHHGAEHLRLLGTMDAWNDRRPLNGLLLAVRLALTGDSFLGALLLQSSMLGVAAMLLARTVARDLGWAAGGLLFFACYHNIAYWLPTTMTEPLGMLLGLLAASLLWSGGRSKSLWAILAGIFVLTMSLNARAGAYFMLPCLALWTGVLFRGERYFHWKYFGLACASIIAAMGFNSVLLMLYGSRAGVGNANFSLVLYGLARGGYGWTAIYSDYPEAAAMSEHEVKAFCYAKAWGLIKANPLMLCRGYYHGSMTFLSGLYDWVGSAVPMPWPWLGWMAMIGGLCRSLLVMRRDPCLWMLLAAFAGTLASGPILFRDGGHRVFVSSHPFLLAFFAIAVAGWRRQPVASAMADISVVPDAHPACGHRTESADALLISGVLVLMALVGPALAHAVYASRPVETMPEGSARNLVVRVGPGTPHIRIAEKGQLGYTFAPDISDEYYQIYVNNWAAYVVRDRAGKHLVGPCCVTMAQNLQKDDSANYYIVTREPLVSDEWKTLILHGERQMQSSMRCFFVDESKESQVTQAAR
jgi:hypothetical protein